ncbi:MAG TPA: SAM-dependent methyltransferase [Anaeromyxobacteraceae bacterium]|nr:SAM-dependent methyltransferase [Anaeromyxobacteraceae bacterium]
MRSRATPPPVIEGVSDTARWVALYRAMESERRDALFRDPYARPLAGPRGEAVFRAMPQARRWAWPMVVRTAVIDEILGRLVTAGGARTVLNLAAGLDARPFRLRLPPELRWLDVDLPAIQDGKRAALERERPRCALEWRAADLSDPAARRAVLAEVARGPAPALAVTEGLLIYLERDAVAALAADLLDCPAIEWWMLDLGSPRLLRLMERTWGRAVAAGGAPFRFAPAEGTAFFERLGWLEVEFRSTWEEGLRLGRTMPFARLWSALARLLPAERREEFRTMSGIVLLRRARPAGGAGR